MDSIRMGEVTRKTKETDIRLQIILEGKGVTSIRTGIGFFDHMLEAFARFAQMDIQLTCQGDLHVDGHHTVEDVGICLGQALARALGDKAGIARIGHAFVPMDEALAFAAVDFSGRPYLRFSMPQAQGMIGSYDACLTEEFFRAVAMNANMTLHMRMETGKNAHHCVEAACKAFGLAIDKAKQRDARIEGVMSTKGTL